MPKADQGKFEVEVEVEVETTSDRDQVGSTLSRWQPAAKTGIAALDFAGGLMLSPAIRELLLAFGLASKRDDDQLDSRWQRLPGPAKMCFQNAATAALDHPELTYVEGYAFSSVFPLPINHGWLTDRAGRVVDPTWAEGSGYFGIPFPQPLLSKALLLTGSYGFIDQLWYSPELLDLIRSEAAAA